MKRYKKFCRRSLFCRTSISVVKEITYLMVKVSCQTELNSFGEKIGRDGGHFEIRSGDLSKIRFSREKMIKKVRW